MNERDEVSAKQSAAFVLKLLWRACGFACLGAVSGAAFGAFNGAWSGGLLGLIAGIGPTAARRLDLLFAGIQMGAVWAICVGAVAGALAFFLASLVAWRVRFFGDCSNVLIHSAAKGATIGTASGAILAVVNYSLYAWFSKQRVDAIFPFYIGGVILGFIIGTFVSAIRVALREVEKQREAAPQTK